MKLWRESNEWENVQEAESKTLYDRTGVVDVGESCIWNNAS
jgi:hypothetical protein